MNSIVRHFSLVYKVKRRWFHRHFTHVRLQHRVRIAATLWHGRKVCKFAMKVWLGRIKQARRNAQKVRTFHMFCPVPHCSMASEVFTAWRLEFVPVARRLRLCKEALIRHRQERAVSDCLDTWSHLYFVAHAKKAGQRRIIQRLRHFSSACSRSWQRLLENCMAARLSTLEKERLLPSRAAPLGGQVWTGGCRGIILTIHLYFRRLCPFNPHEIRFALPCALSISQIIEIPIFIFHSGR